MTIYCPFNTTGNWINLMLTWAEGMGTNDTQAIINILWLRIEIAWLTIGSTRDDNDPFTLGFKMLMIPNIVRSWNRLSNWMGDFWDTRGQHIDLPFLFPCSQCHAHAQNHVNNCKSVINKMSMRNCNNVRNLWVLFEIDVYNALKICIWIKTTI